MRFSLSRLLLVVALTAIAFWIYRFAPPVGWIVVSILASIFVGFFALRDKHYWIASIAAGMLLMLVVLLPTMAVTGHSVPIGLLGKIQSGDSASFVQATIGLPTAITSSAEGEVWHYQQTRWCRVEVHFDPDHNVLYVVHDH